MKKLRLREAGDMIASDPYNPNKEITIIDVIAMELEKLSQNGSIPQALYSQALDLARGQKKVINNIYSRNGRDIKPIIMLLLRQVRNRLKQLFIYMNKERFQKLAGLLKESDILDRGEADRIKKGLSRVPKKESYNWALFQNAVEDKLKQIVDPNARFLIDTDEGMQEPISMEFEEIVPSYVKAAKVWCGNSFERFVRVFEDIDGAKLDTVEEVAEAVVSNDSSELVGMGDLIPSAKPVALLRLHETAEFVIFED